MIGKTLAHYQIRTKIGEGAMGEVYLAKDTKLGREVALKLLPAETAADPERLERFRREAQAIAALNHPNIVTIHSVEEADGVHLLTMELVDGESLDQMLPPSGFDLERLFPLAIQIADALASAHEKGIIHRDLKPANVMVTGDARVKVLDFGLAKLAEAEAGDEATQLMTQAGMLLGTVPYMSPEQVQGQPVDHRSDIFSLGILLYEMATGKRPFRGDNPASVISAVLKDRPPPVTELRTELPNHLGRIVRRCLEKQPQRRYQSAREIQLELEGLEREISMAGGASGSQPAAERPPSIAAATGAASRARWPGLVPWAIAVIAVVALVVGSLRKPGPGAGDGIGRIERLIEQASILAGPTFAEDGSSLAFASNEDGDFEIYLQRTDGGEAVNITDHPADDVQPALSPDGSRIAFVSTRAARGGLSRISDNLSYDYRTFGGDVWVTSALGGQARRIAEAGNYPDWAADGRSVVYVAGPEFRREIRRVPETGGVPETLLSTLDSQWEIVRVRHSPDGRWLTLETHDDQLLVMPADGGEPAHLIPASSHAWAEKSVFYLKPDIRGAVEVRRVGFDTKAGTVEPDTDRRLGFLTGVFGDLIASGDGTRLVAIEFESSSNLARVPIDPERGEPTGPEEPLTRGKVLDRVPEVSRDGTYVAFESTPGSDDTIAILNLETGERSRLELPGARNMNPTWHPDSRHLAVLRQFENGAEYWKVASDGSTASRMFEVTASPSIDAAHFSPGGESVAFTDVVDGMEQIFVADAASGTRRQITSSPSLKFDIVWSPDGRWLTYASNATGSFQVWRVALETGVEQQMTEGPGRVLHPSYSPDGQWLYVQPDHKNIWRLPAHGGPMTQVTRFPESNLYIDEPNISADGRAVIYTRSTASAGLWLLSLEQAVAGSADG